MSWELLESLGKIMMLFFIVMLTFSLCKLRLHQSAYDIVYHKKDRIGFAQANHYMEDVFKGGISYEMDKIIEVNRDTKQSIDATKMFFKKNDESVNLNANGYVMNTTFEYNFNDCDVRKLLSEFWKIYTSKNITYRDQPHGIFYY